MSEGAQEQLRTRLRELGDRRKAAQAAERAELEAIVALLPQAVEADISKQEISRLTGMSRVWINELLRRYDES